MWIALGWFQGALNLVFLSAAILWYRTYRRELAERERVTACLNVLESHGARHEQEWNLLRSQLQEQLKALHTICEEAKGILSQGHSALVAGGNSREERDLRDALVPEVKSENIPTVETIEKAQARPEKQGWLDLKTLFREQLV